MVVYSMFSVLNLCPEIKYVVLSTELRDCSAWGQTSLSDEAECLEAAKQLGIRYRSTFSDPDAPKGCFAVIMYGHYGVHWNTHKTGDKRHSSFPICRNGGNHNH